ncbi:MAG: serine protease [Bdellovibrio sp. CG10_big_fil_rev_8_21_14_0_10_47_8]|nr:MAG: serine protease [Bdellovibrio sp. CG10_big_fil_rev_8_21_14_0_10_47_8]
MKNQGSFKSRKNLSASRPVSKDHRQKQDMRWMLSLLAIAMLSVALTACGKPDSSVATLTEDNESSENIIGGQDVAVGDSVGKSTVGVGHALHGVICTGTLIAKNLVLTAGHCTGATGGNPKELYISFGLNLEKGSVLRKVLGGKTTDAWPQLSPSQEKDWGDIAILRFEGEAPAGFSPASILNAKAALKNGMDVTLAGFGATSMKPQAYPDHLLKTTVKLTNANYSASELLFKQYQGRGACHGDSGGPAYIVLNKKLILVGVTSRSATPQGGATCMDGSIYTSTAAHIQFIRSATKELNSKSFVAGAVIPQPR